MSANRNRLDSRLSELRQNNRQSVAGAQSHTALQTAVEASLRSAPGEKTGASPLHSLDVVNQSTMDSRPSQPTTTKALLLLALGVLCTAGLLLAPRQVAVMHFVVAALIAAATLSGCISCFLAARTAPGQDDVPRRAWRLLGAALGCLSAGVLLQLAVGALHLRLPRFPGIGDLFWVAQQVLMALALFELARIHIKRAPRERAFVRVAMDTFIIVLSIVALTWVTLLEPLLSIVKMPALSRLLLLSYPLLDLVLLAGAFLLFFAARGRLHLTRVAGLILLGVLALALTNSIYLFQVAHRVTPARGFALGTAFDLGWIWAGLFIGAAALVHLAVSSALPQNVAPETDSKSAIEDFRAYYRAGEEEMKTEGERSERRWQTLLVAWLPYVAALGTTLFLIGYEYRTGNGESVRHMLPALSLLMIVVLRQLLTLKENTLLSDRLRDVNFSLEQVNTDLEQSVQDRTQHLATLHGITSTLNTSLDRRTVLRVALERTITATGADGGGIWLRVAEDEASAADSVGVNDAATNPLESGVINSAMSKANAQDPQSQGWKLAHSFGFSEQDNTLNSLRDLAVAAAEDQNAGVPLIPSTPGGQTDGHALSPQNVVLVPIRWGGALLGTFGLFRARGAFTHEDRALAESVAMETGTALQNARLYQEARHRADRDSVTGLLNHRAMQERLNAALSASRRHKIELVAVMMDLNNFKFFNDTYGHPTGDEVLRTVARHLQEVCRENDVVGRYGGDEFIVLLPDTGSEGARDFCLRVASRLGEEHFQTDSGSRIPIEMSFGWAVYPRDAESALELLTLADSNLYEYKHSGGFKDKSHVEATEQGRIEIRKLKNRASGGSFGVLDALVTAIDNKDHYTRRHSEEVTHYSLLVAKELGYSEEALRAVRISGLLHDVGKIAVPDEILRHPGELGKDEWEIMRQHPAFGALIVKDLPHLDEVLDGVRHHHERWDGKGYPDALAESNIPMMGRLLAVGDCFSAMTTNRPYRKAFLPEDALREIEKGAGIQFDPMIAKTFIRVMRRELSGSNNPQDTVPSISSDEMEEEISRGVTAAVPLPHEQEREERTEEKLAEKARDEALVAASAVA